MLWARSLRDDSLYSDTHLRAYQVIISDAVVWWRACAIWSGNQWVRVLCAITLAGTLGECFRYTTVLDLDSYMVGRM